MILIDDKIISRDVIEKKFICNLNACKGACCWEGDFGAPLETEEIEKVEAIFPMVKPYLSEASIRRIEQNGTSSYYKEEKETGTSLMENGACVFMILDENRIAKCGIEAAYLDKKIDFQKPISCHLYPIRVKKHKNFEAVNYDDWDICSAACELGEKEQMPTYQFLKEALVRKYGIEFYEELDATAKHLDAKHVP